MLESYHRIALIADLHGHVDILSRALGLCATERVESLVFLGDLIDRDDQADACVSLLKDWRAFGVFGNHEQHMVAALTMGADLGLKPETAEFFARLEERIALGDVCFLHDEMELPRYNPVLNFFSQNVPRNGNDYRILFVGHTHHRAAVSDFGPLDLAHNIVLDPNRRYIINPGPLVGGQFAIWDRAESVVRFKQVR